jgi:uncharacterized protein (TIGR00299 family) protein
MPILYLDCFSGISGDMMVGALADLGISPSAFEWELGKLEIEDYHLHFARQERRGIAGVKFDVHTDSSACESADFSASDSHSPSQSGSHSHSHSHPRSHSHSHSHPHPRSHSEIRELIEQSGLSKFVKTRSLAIFHRIAEAEAKIHAVPIDRVHFDEVGAVDSIVDIVLTCVGIEALGVSHIYVSSLVDGNGSTHCAHGEYPVPAPATLEILKGIPLRQIAVPFELITPTGAAIVAEFQRQIGPMPPLRTIRVGYGLGTRDLSPRPNVLRAILGELEQTAEAETVVEIQANIDDLSAEILAASQEHLLQAGALDVFFTPVQMKKNRPGTLLTVLCDRAHLDQIQQLIFHETTTFGLRFREASRRVLDRELRSVDTELGPIRVKIGRLGDEIVQVSPEYEDCRSIARKTSMPLKRIYEIAAANFWKQNTPVSEIEH